MRNHSNHLMLAVAAVVGFFVLAAIGVPVLANLPLLGFLVVCPLMMFFMMRGMGHGRGHDDESVGDPDDRREHRASADSADSAEDLNETAGAHSRKGS